MAKPTGFLEYDRKNPPKRPVAERLKDYREIEQLMPEPELLKQAARCMDCGVPYCHAYGCPVANLIPDFNDMIYRGQWRKALDLLHSTNNFPEFTGRVCPALCEAACTLNLDQKAVSIRHIELQIAERGWQEGWIEPEPPERKTGFKIAIIGSGPAGLAAAQQLARSGHDVTVFEKDTRIGGILRYGIPDYKLDKSVIDRRLGQLRAEGVRFETSVDVGKDISAAYLMRSFDAILISTGARVPRDLKVPGRELKGVHFAMEYLVQQNRLNAGDHIAPEARLTAEDKKVAVIGGGDTGSDCIGSANRQGAASVTQLEILPQPPETPAERNPWPTWPNIMRTSTSHEEGCERMWSVATKEFLGDAEGRVKTLRCVRLEWFAPDSSGRQSFKEIPGSKFDLDAELVLLAMGFVHAEHGPLIEEFGLATDERGNVKIGPDYMTSSNGVFAAGDSVKGASLVVHAISLGRKAATAIDQYLASDARGQ